MNRKIAEKVEKALLEIELSKLTIDELGKYVAIAQNLASGNRYADLIEKMTEKRFFQNEKAIGDMTERGGEKNDV